MGYRCPVGGRDLFHVRPYRQRFRRHRPLGRDQTLGLAAPVFGPDTDIVNVAAHFTEYLVFGGLLVLAARRTWPALGWGKLALVAIALASLYAVTDEFHQSFVPGRVCDPADWLTDTLGAALGASAAVLALEKMLAKRQMG